jgi:hypothetical protein
MAKLWQGEKLRDRLSEELGDTRTTFKARVLEFLNDVQEDICSAYDWPFLKIKLKKYIAAGTQEVDLSPQIPSAPTAAISAGGSLTDGTYSVKVTFLIYDETGKEENSIESEPSDASGDVVSSGSNDTITLTNIDTMDGSTSVKPTTIYRRIYLKKDSGDYVLSKTLSDNTTTTTTITVESTSTIEPPDRSMISRMADEDPFIEASNVKLSKTDTDIIRSYDPSGSSGTPQDYAREGRNKILLYPAPSTAITLSYYVYKRPSRIFAETARALQMPQEIGEALKAGVIWRGFRYRDREGQESKYADYVREKLAAVNLFKKKGGKFGRVRDVDGDWRGREIS